MEIIKLTPQAQLAATKHLRDKGQLDSHGLRISVIGGGCSGLRYELKLDIFKEEDAVHDYEEGLRVIVDEKSALYLMGCELEYYSDLNKTGFEVKNPSASTTCGCGESFSA